MPKKKKLAECDSCGWKTSLEQYDAYARTPVHGPLTSDEEKKWAWLCDVCALSPAGNAYLYPRSHEYDGDILRMIAWVTNRIIKETRLP